MLLDAYVNQRILENGEEYITDHIVDAFQAQWANKTATFATVYGLNSEWRKALHMYLPTYANRHVCAAAEQISTSSVMGTNGNGQCVYGWIPHNASFGFLDLAPSILHSNWFWDYIS